MEIPNMTHNEISELYRLLGNYAIAMIDLDAENKMRLKKRKANHNKEDYVYHPELECITGVKSQYNHARCILRILAKNIEDGMNT